MLSLFIAASVFSATPADVEALARSLGEFDARVIVRGENRQPPLAHMLGNYAQTGLRAGNRVDRLAWNEVQSRADWERFRDVRLRALRESLGQFPPVPKYLKPRVTRRLEGDGFDIDNLVFESRPGIFVTANLYRPAKPSASMPAVLICHSHQQPKDTGARQDMAMTWARAGCVVLVPDHLGHGERRQHPFGDEGPHDYHGRYDLGIQLHLAGESLMGWLAWDLMRGVDVLLAEKGVDLNRIVLISEPAGGGDVAAVAAALDERISAVMIQNFGGPEPESPYPLPPDAEESFEYSGSGSWESTRNLRLSVRDGFLPWTIVASIAPRRLIYYHEFYWDREHDPVWKRLQRVYSFYDKSDSLVGLNGRGFVVGSPPENTHWLAENRELLYPTLKRWFEIPSPSREYDKRRPTAELRCLTPELMEELKPRPVHLLLGELGAARAAVRRAGIGPSVAELRGKMGKDWTRLLGDVAPLAKRADNASSPERSEKNGILVEKFQLASEPGILVPVLLLRPVDAKEPAPVVLGISQQGKQEFLKHRSGPIAELLASGIAVCLPDVRGTGETDPGGGRERNSPATSISSSEWMRGQSLLGGRLRDLRTVIHALRLRTELDHQRIALWGESFAPVNLPDQNLLVAHNAPRRPASSEPLGGLLALLGALYEDEVRAVYVQGGLADYQSACAGPFCYLPHDTVVPGVLTLGDLPELAACLSPRPLRMNGLVDGLNRRVKLESLQRTYAQARATYAEAKVANHISFGEAEPSESGVATWFRYTLAGR